MECGLPTPSKRQRALTPLGIAHKNLPDIESPSTEIHKKLPETSSVVLLHRNDFVKLCAQLEMEELSCYATLTALQAAMIQGPQHHDYNVNSGLDAGIHSPASTQLGLPGMVSLGKSTTKDISTSGKSKSPTSTSQLDSMRQTKSSKLIDFLKDQETFESKKVSMNSSTKLQLKRIFQHIDTDGSGFLSQEELREAAETNMPTRNNNLIREVLDQAMAKADKDHDGVLDYEEFLDLTVDDEASFLQRHKLVFKVLLCVSFFAISPIVYCNLNKDQGDWSVWDALYFSAVTLTTVGYGDLHPVNDSMMAFTIFYIIFGLACVAGIVNESVSLLVAYYEDKMQQLNRKMCLVACETMGSVQSSSLRMPMPVNVWTHLVNWCGLCTPKIPMCSLHVARKVWTLVLLFVLPNAVATTFISLNEGWSWLQGLYWSIVTSTTVGYGDLRLEQESSRIFAFFFILTGFAFAGASLFRIAALKVELAMERTKQQILSRTLSMDMIADMDQDGDGVDRCEYLCGMLLQLNKVNKEDLYPLLCKFEELDVDKDGVLTYVDLTLANRNRRKVRLSRSRFDSRFDTCWDEPADPITSATLSAEEKRPTPALESRSRSWLKLGKGSCGPCERKTCSPPGSEGTHDGRRNGTSGTCSKQQL